MSIEIQSIDISENNERNDEENGEMAIMKKKAAKTIIRRQHGENIVANIA